MDRTPRNWSMDEFIDTYTKKHIIKIPFTPDERDLARNLASAYYYYHYLGELPDRALEGAGEGYDFWTPELTAFNAGIFRVQMIHGEFPELTSVPIVVKDPHRPRTRGRPEA